MTDIKRKPREYYQRAFPGPFNILPPAVVEKKQGQLSDTQIRQFFDEVRSFKIYMYTFNEQQLHAIVLCEGTTSDLKLF